MIDPKEYYSDRQAELLTERVESGQITATLGKTKDSSYEVTVSVPPDGWTMDVYVSQDDAAKAYDDAMQDYSDLLADMADDANDRAKDKAMMEATK